MIISRTLEVAAGGEHAPTATLMSLTRHADRFALSGRIVRGASDEVPGRIDHAGEPGQLPAA